MDPALLSRAERTHCTLPSEQSSSPVASPRSTIGIFYSPWDKAHTENRFLQTRRVVPDSDVGEGCMPSNVTRALRRGERCDPI